MSTRKERKAAAEIRRTQWKLRWIQVARSIPEGSGLRRRIEAIAHDCERLCIEQPTHKSEIILALDEFVKALAHKTVEVMKEQEPTP